MCVATSPLFNLCKGDAFEWSSNGEENKERQVQETQSRYHKAGLDRYRYLI